MIRLFSTILFVIAFLQLISGQTADDFQNDLKKRLKGHIEYLASDAQKGRDAVNPEIDSVTNFLKNKLVQYNLDSQFNSGSYFQNIPLVKVNNSQKSKAIVISGKDTIAVACFDKDFVIYPRVNKDTVFSGQIIFGGYGIVAPEYNYNDFADLDLEGKVPLVFYGEPNENDPESLFNGLEKTRYYRASTKSLIAGNKKAAALIIIADSSQILEAQAQNFIRAVKEASVLFGDPHNTKTLNIIYGGYDFAAKILHKSVSEIVELRRMSDLGQMPSSINLGNLNVNFSFDVDEEKINGKNILGVIEGSDPTLKNEFIILSAHYDHLGTDENGNVFNGADDNASGVAALLEIAKYFGDHQPRRSLAFLFDTAEEYGLIGSKYYSENPIIPFERTIANINLDMVGRSNGSKNVDTLYLITGLLSSQLSGIGTELSSKYSFYINKSLDDKNHPSKAFYRSDHYNFVRNGVPALYFSTGEHSDYHKITDTAEKIDYDVLSRIVKMNIDILLQIANSDEGVILNPQEN